MTSKITRAITRAAEEAIPEPRTRELVRHWADSLNRSDLLACATEYLLGAMRRSERAAVLMVERDHVAPESARRNREAQRQQRAAEGLKRDAVVAERSKRLASVSAQIDNMVARHSAALAGEWTQSLLSSALRMPDGSLTTWGAATIDQHRQRVVMLQAQAAAGVEGAARHLRAIATLEAAGVPSLNSLPSGAVAA